PTAASAIPSPPARSSSWARRSPTFAAASAKFSQRPVRTSTSEAINSPTRCSSSGVPWAAAWSSSNRFTSESVSGSRTANSSSTATVKSVPFSYASRARRICSSGVSFCASPISAPSSNTCRLLARDHAAPEPTLALAKAASLGRERVRPLAWCSRPRSSASLLEGALMDLAIRAIVLYAFVFTLTRVVGRRELSSLQPFDLILLIVLGDSIQQGLTQDDYSVTGAAIVVGTIAVLQVATSYVSFRVPFLRPVLDGQPIVVVEDGKAIERNLHRERLSLEDLMEEA